MTEIRLYGSTPQVERRDSHRRLPILRTAVAVTVLTAAAVLCIWQVVPQSKPASLLWWESSDFLRPEESWYDPPVHWEDNWAEKAAPIVVNSNKYPVSDPWEDEEYLTTPVSADEDNFGLPSRDLSFHSDNGCIPQPFSELPEGYLCSSPSYGVYLLDTYGNMYPRGVQRLLRDVMDKSSKSIERVVINTPQVDAARERANHKGRWVNPASWLAPSLLPNSTECQDTVTKFYQAISTPLNITDMAGLLAEGFLYQAPEASGLLPACIADLGGHKVVGADDWMNAFENQSLAFNGSRSELVGNLTCRATPTENVLAPQMVCVAHQKCTYALQDVKSSSGEHQVLTGEIFDRFWFNSKGQIIRYKSEADPALFRHTNISLVEEAASEEAAE